MSIVGSPPEDVERVVVRKAAVVRSNRPMEIRARAKAIAKSDPGTTFSYIMDVLTERELERITELLAHELVEEKLATEKYRYSVRVKEQPSR